MHKRIVILGGGFAGLYTYKHLRRLLARVPDVRITLVSEKNYLLFTPLLHEVATGGLMPEVIIEPIRTMLDLSRSDFCKARVKRISLTTAKVETSEGELPYDYLVLALGSETNFYNTPGASEHAYSIKTLADAARIKNQILANFEHAVYAPEQERSSLGTVVVVGGGPTGVELAGELAEFLNRTLLPTYGAGERAEPSVILLERGERILGYEPERVSNYARDVLMRKGVNVRASMTVAEVSGDGVLLKSGDRIAARIVIWAAGVKPRALKLQPPSILEADGRIPVDALLRVRGYENVFALGDLAAVTDAHGVRVPDLAQSASKEAKVAAHNIAAAIVGTKQRVFTWRPTGFLISLGRWAAVGNIYGIFVKGPHIWWLWRTVYLFKMLSWQKKLAVAVAWTVNLFSRRDVSEL